MSELNYTTLREALDRLPEYAAPEGIWESLEPALDMDEQLAAGIPGLPVYAPPASIWSQIEAQLDTPDTGTVPARRPRTFFLRPAAIWSYSAAAALALLLAAWWFWRPADAPMTGVKMAVTQEVVDDQLLDANREAEDDAFALVQQLCRNPSTVCSEPEFQSLKTELDELTSAKSALKSALGNYGDDPELHAQLARIERERSQLLRQMMSMI